MTGGDLDVWTRRIYKIQCETCCGSGLGFFCDDCCDTGLAPIPLCEVIARFRERGYYDPDWLG